MNNITTNKQTISITPNNNTTSATKNMTNIPQNQHLYISTPVNTNNKDHSSPNNQYSEIPESSNSRNHTPSFPRSFLYSESEINEGINACNHSIIGKIITDKPIHVSSIQNGLDSIWGAPPGLKIQELGGKILQFFMNDLADKDRILLGNPWIFRNSWLVVKPWDRKKEVHTVIP
jgi:hypothetical protein